MLHTNSNEEIWKNGGAWKTLLSGRKTMSSNMVMFDLFQYEKLYEAYRCMLGVTRGCMRQLG